MQTWIVPSSARLDVFLAEQDAFLSRVKAQKAVEAGLILVNDALCTKSSTKLEPEDIVTYDEESDLQDAVSDIDPVNLHLPVLYNDERCLVIAKPAGIAVHPGAGMPKDEPTILHGIAWIFGQEKRAFSPPSVLVHRLDKETTGCLLIAKDPEAHLLLQKQFEDRTVRKKYLALVFGVPEHASALIDSPIGRSGSDRTKMSVRGVGVVRAAKTAYRVLATNARLDVALVECDLHTGRTHQIRVHLSSIDHPILGDPSYQTAASVRLGTEYDIHDLCLHAWQLTFVSPADSAEHVVEAPLSKMFRETLEKLGIKFQSGDL